MKRMLFLLAITTMFVFTACSPDSAPNEQTTSNPAADSSTNTATNIPANTPTITPENNSTNTPAEETPASEQNSLGASIVKANCLVCHGSGMNGAPIVGNKEMWAGRIAKGLPALVESATNGFGLMPAKGGRMTLSDEEISQAVSWMVEQSQ